MNRTAHLAKLRADRRLVRGFVVLGVLASLGANAIDSATALNAAVAMWPPVALLSVLEILPRIPIGRWYSTLGRVAATLAVAAAAGWLSYSHMASVAASHGESALNARIWPISIDGLMAVAAIALVEIGARIRTLESTQPVPVHPVAAVLAEPSIAPVSPAPVGMRMAPGPLGIMTAKPLPPARRDVRAMRVLSQS